MLVNINALSRYLQGVSLDLSVVRQTSAGVIGTLRQIRNEESFLLLRKKADLICSQIPEVLEDEETSCEFREAALPRRRRVRRRLDEGVVAFTDIDEYYKVMVYYPIDSLIGEIEQRFEKKQQLRSADCNFQHYERSYK